MQARENGAASARWRRCWQRLSHPWMLLLWAPAAFILLVLVSMMGDSTVGSLIISPRYAGRYGPTAAVFRVGEDYVFTWNHNEKYKQLFEEGHPHATVVLYQRDQSAGFLAPTRRVRIQSIDISNVPGIGYSEEELPEVRAAFYDFVSGLGLRTRVPDPRLRVADMRETRILFGGYLLNAVILCVIACMLGSLWRLGQHCTAPARRHRHRRRAHLLGLCPACGYSIDGLLSSICPECGTALPTAPTPPPPADQPRSHS